MPAFAGMTILGFIFLPFINQNVVLAEARTFRARSTGGHVGADLLTPVTVGGAVRISRTSGLGNRRVWVMA